MCNNNTWQWKEKSYFLPFLIALYGEFLKGRGKLKLRRSFASALKSLPNRCHDDCAYIRQFLTEETDELKIHRGNCCVAWPAPAFQGHSHMLQMSKWRLQYKRRQIRGKETYNQPLGLNWHILHCTPWEWPGKHKCRVLYIYIVNVIRQESVRKYSLIFPIKLIL